MKTTHLILAGLFGAALASQAVTVEFDNLIADGGAGGALPDATLATDGLDRVYSYSVTGDFDEGGVNNDTLTFDMRHSVFNNGTIVVNGNDSSVTLGAAFAVDPTPLTTNFGLADDGDGLEDWDNKDTMRFSMENIDLTTDISGFSATFDGFDAAFLGGGTGVDYIFGEGTGLTSISVAASANVSFGPLTTLTITADTNNRAIRQLDGSFTVAAIPEPSSFALIGGLLALSSVMLRRRRA